MEGFSSTTSAPLPLEKKFQSLMQTTPNMKDSEQTVRAPIVQKSHWDFRWKVLFGAVIAYLAYRFVQNSEWCKSFFAKAKDDNSADSNQNPKNTSSQHAQFSEVQEDDDDIVEMDELTEAEQNDPYFQPLSNL